MSKKLTALIAALALCLLGIPILHAQISPGSAGTFTSATINGVPIFAGQGLIGVQTFCASGCTSTGGIYTPDPGTNRVVVEVQAPSGGGAGCAAPGAGNMCVNGSPGAGSYEKALITSGFSGVTVTAPAGGTGAATGQNTGGPGSPASFGTLISCSSTSGVSASALGAPTAWTPSGTGSGIAPACSGTGVTVIDSVPGRAGNVGVAGGTSANLQLGGAGVSTPLGVGGTSQMGTQSPGSPSSGFGASPSGSSSSATGTAESGFNGGPGIVIVYEFN
jgi:hypothetical protein